MKKGDFGKKTGPAPKHIPKPNTSVSTNIEDKDSSEPKKETKSDEEYGAQFDLPVQDVRDIRDLFLNIDTDGGGEIDASELKALFATLGKQITDSQAKEMIGRVDRDGGGTVDFEAFLQLIAAENKEDKAKDPVVEARRIFNMFDKDGSGSVDFSDTP